LHPYPVNHRDTSVSIQFDIVVVHPLCFPELLTILDHNADQKWSPMVQLSPTMQYLEQPVFRLFTGMTGNTVVLSCTVTLNCTGMTGNTVL
jgi:hypothetical protein